MKHLIAGLWFAGVVFVIGVIIFLLSGGMDLLWVICLSALMAALSGASFGAGILDRGKTPTPLIAIGRGLLVTLVTIGLVSTCAAFASGQGECVSPTIIWLWCFFVTLVFMGWLLFPIGGLAGWLLWYLSKGWHSDKKKRTLPDIPFLDLP